MLLIPFYSYVDRPVLIKLLIFANFRDLCGRHVSRIPYNELGSVDRGRCCCWVYVDSSFGSLSPGCGCDAERVDFIVSELRIRMRNHGNWTQIQRAEQTMQKLDDLNTKLVRRKTIPFVQDIFETDFVVV